MRYPDEFRDDLCVAQIDYAFLTDHGNQLDITGFDPSTSDPMHPVASEGDNAMLFSSSVGDQFVVSDELVVRNGTPVANRATCRQLLLEVRRRAGTRPWCAPGSS